MTDDEPQPVNHMLDALDQVKMILELLDGYRAECLSRGYTEDEARQMAVDFHHMMCYNQPSNKDES